MSAAERIEAALLLLRSTYREPPPDDELMAEALECATARAVAKQYRLSDGESE